MKIGSNNMESSYKLHVVLFRISRKVFTYQVVTHKQLVGLEPPRCAKPAWIYPSSQNQVTRLRTHLHGRVESICLPPSLRHCSPGFMATLPPRPPQLSGSLKLKGKLKICFCPRLSMTLTIVNLGASGVPSRQLSEENREFLYWIKLTS